VMHPYRFKHYFLLINKVWELQGVY